MSDATVEARAGDPWMKASEARQQSRYAVALVVLAVLAAYLYGRRLDEVPAFLHHDEMLVGLSAESIARSGRDLSGRFMPVYVQIPSTVNWYPPIVVYATAAWLSVVPLSDIAVRLPNACVGVLSVVLMYFVARRVSHDDRLGLLAAALLAVTPAHFIQSRISTDSLYPVVFVLLWLLCLLRFLDRPTPWRVFLATSVLGIGVYSYVASVVMMPVYLVMTLAMLLWGRYPLRHVVFAAAGFAWPMLFAAAFLAQYPEILGDFSAKYRLGGGQADLNPLQRMRETFTSWNISDRLNLFHSFFDPGYLFVTGGTNIAHSTRQAGVFLAPMAAFMSVGAYETMTRPTRATLLVLAGFLTAPAAAVIVSESYAIPRELPVLPFGVLLATLGVAVMWRASMSRSPKALAVTLALGLLILGTGYAARMLIGQGRLSGSALVVIVMGAALWVIGRECERRRSWRPVAAGLLLLIPVQFYVFQRDYFGDYRARSAARYGHNLRGAIEEVIALRDRTGGATVYLNQEIPYVRDYWEFYLKVHRRTELIAPTTTLDSQSDILGDLQPGSLLLTDASERALAAFGGRRDFVQVGLAKDPGGDGEAPDSGPTMFIIYQKL